MNREMGRREGTAASGMRERMGGVGKRRGAWRTLAVFIAALAAALALPATALAEGGDGGGSASLTGGALTSGPIRGGNVVASGSCGADVAWELAGEGHDLTLSISGEGAMYDIPVGSDDGAPWHDYRTKIMAITIENGVTSIGDYAFDVCSNLKSVEIPDSVTSIGRSAFFGCVSLESVEIPDGVTSIGRTAFADCLNLKSVEIPDSVTSIADGAFNSCHNLESAEIPASVTSIGKFAFFGCENLEKVYFGGTEGQYGGLIGNSQLPAVGTGKVLCMKYAVSVSVSPAGGGAVRGWGTYSSDGSYTLTAVPAKDYHFVSWVKEEEVAGTDTTYSFTPTGNCQFTANFGCEVKASANLEDGGTVLGGKTYKRGQTATLTAVPANGYVFDQWTEDGATVADEQGKKVGTEYSFTVAGDRTLVANFRKVLIDDINPQQYTGEQITPNVPTVQLDGVDSSVNAALIVGEDYTLSYGDNVHAGKGAGTVTLTFEGDFTGEATKAFDIDPRELAVETGSASKAYDGTALANDSVTIGGDGFAAGETATVKATGSQTEVGSSPNTYSITWDGTALKSDYAVSKETLGALKVTKNGSEVTLTAPSASKTYDGKPLTCDGTGDKKVTASGLPKNFAVEATASGSRTDFGTSANVVDDGYVIRNAAGEDRTANFTNVKKAGGTLTIDKREVVLASENGSKVYDGSALVKPKVTGWAQNDETGTGFVTGEVKDVTATGSATAVGDGKVTNAISYTEGAAFKAGNYVITKMEGKLSIEKRAVKFSGRSETKDFTGREIEISTVVAEGLVEGQTHNVAFSAKGTEPGEYEGSITAKDKVVIKSGDADVTANYDVAVAAGKLTIVGQSEFTVAFVNWDGTVLQSGKVHYGKTPRYTGKTPAKAATARYSYSFTGWSPKVAKVTGAATYKAAFTKKTRSYTVRFVDWDGKVLQSGKLAYGKTPKYAGKTPARKADARYTYEFEGWTPKVAKVAGAATYKAAYSKSALGKPKISSTVYPRSSTATVGWTAVAGARSYELQWRALGGAWRTTQVKGTSKSVGGLVAGKLYQFRVRAAAGAARGAWSNVSRRYLRPVSLASVKRAGAGAVSVGWRADPEVDAGYVVIVRDRRGGKVIAREVVPASATSATVRGLPAGKKVWVRVRSLRDVGGKAYVGVLSAGRYA